MSMTSAAMNQTTSKTLFEHNLWANLELFERCADLSDAQLDQSVTGTFGTIRQTLHHIAAAEYSYWHRLHTGKPYRRPTDAPPPSMAELMESIRVSGKGLVDLASEVAANDSVVVDWDGVPRAVPSVILLVQAVNHATEHRAEIKVILTQLGLEPPELSGWSYFDSLD